MDEGRCEQCDAGCGDGQNLHDHTFYRSSNGIIARDARCVNPLAGFAKRRTGPMTSADP